MKTAAFALACLLGAAATNAAAGEDVPVYNLPPFPSTPPTSTAPVAGVTAPSAGLRAYAPSQVRAEVAHSPHGRVCFSQAETRDKIVQRRLTDPVSATRAGRAEGETLRTRLCRWKQDELVYEVYVLRRDGRIVHLYINAQNGQAVSAADIADHK